VRCESGLWRRGPRSGSKLGKPRSALAPRPAWSSGGARRDRVRRMRQRGRSRRTSAGCRAPTRRAPKMSRQRSNAGERRAQPTRVRPCPRNRVRRMHQPSRRCRAGAGHRALTGRPRQRSNAGERRAQPTRVRPCPRRRTTKTRLRGDQQGVAASSRGHGPAASRCRASAFSRVCFQNLGASSMTRSSGQVGSRMSTSRR
jgi:hypothetical protein